MPNEGCMHIRYAYSTQQILGCVLPASPVCQHQPSQRKSWSFHNAPLAWPQNITLLNPVSPGHSLSDIHHYSLLPDFHWQVPNRPVDANLVGEKVQQVEHAISDSLTTSVDTPGTSKGRDSTRTRDAVMTEARLAAEDVAQAAKNFPQAAGRQCQE
jgi:hypothetical protein